MNIEVNFGFKGGGYDPYNSATTSKRWINARYGRAVAGGILRLFSAVFFPR